jgi:hypothetical protein
VPTAQETDEILDIIVQSLKVLVARDRDLFNTELVEPPAISDDAKILNRELFETTINHRLAVYLEQNLQPTRYSDYHVDIEYNRYYQNEKLLQTMEGLIAVRPDIIIHTRMRQDANPQHLLIVEAKKGKTTEHDRVKIKGFLSDPKYRYQFGLAISYCRHPKNITGILYQEQNGDVIERLVEVSRN